MRTALSIPIIPPFMREIALINNVRGNPGPNQRQDEIAIFRAQEMSRTGVAPALNPVDAIQPLNDANAAPARFPQ